MRIRHLSRTVRTRTGLARTDRRVHPGRLTSSQALPRSTRSAEVPDPQSGVKPFQVGSREHSTEPHRRFMESNGDLADPTHNALS
jgi:hypothetical protein